MNKLLVTLLLCPLLSTAQKTVPRFENDTLYTTSGFKIYKGQTLHFGKGSYKNRYYRFINIKSGAMDRQLPTSTLLVKDLKNFGISVLYNGYIDISGTITFKDGSTNYLEIHVAFDRAIENDPKLVSELAVPDEFRNKPGGNKSDEIMKLFKKYAAGDLTKEEYEEQKKKILEGQ
jgi:Short C-terminal domain